MSPSDKKFSKLAFYAAATASAQEAKRRLVALYGEQPLAKAELLIALGGDGAMLSAVHKIMTAELKLPVYGMNRGSIGFLMNEYRANGLLARLVRAKPTLLTPLLMKARTLGGESMEALAINEVSLLRQTHQSAHIRITVDGKMRMGNLIGDGVLIATPAGSTAYNLSASGPIVPLNAGVLAVTAISPFRPRRWRGALVSHGATVHFKILQAATRPVLVAADSAELRDVVGVTVRRQSSASFTLLFDPGHALEERITAEQWAHT